MKTDFYIKDLFEVVSGSTPSTSIDEYWADNENGIKWITPKDLSGLNSTYISLTERKISIDGLNSCSTRLIPKGSVIISSRAPIGYVAILDSDMSCNQGCKALVPRSHKLVHPLYIYYLFRAKKLELNNLGSGSTFKELSKAKLENFKVSLLIFKHKSK